MTKTINHLGETRMANCGEEMTIISYRTNKDMDVLFANGSIRKHVNYQAFSSGSIRPEHEEMDAWRAEGAEPLIPGLLPESMHAPIRTLPIRPARSFKIKIKGKVRKERPTTGEKRGGNKLKTERVGETRRMGCGLMATIIAYRANNDIDVQFENGLIREHRTYQTFFRGEIAPPWQARIGEEVILPNGEKTWVVEYRKSRDIDVGFEDGSIKQHVTYQDFLRGKVAHPNKDKNRIERIGQVSMHIYGVKMTLIGYRNSMNCDAKLEDGLILKNIRYSEFRDGICSRRAVKAHLATLY